MASLREMRLRIRSIRNLSQVTRALETVSASKVRRSIQTLNSTHPYAEKAWKVVVHLARQPGRISLHPLLSERTEVRKALTVLICSERGLAGALNIILFRKTLYQMKALGVPVDYISVGRKGRDLLLRGRLNVIADFSGISFSPSFAHLSPVGRLVVDEFTQNRYDQIYIAHTHFHSLLKQTPEIRKLLPLIINDASDRERYNITHIQSKAVFSYEPDQEDLLKEIIPRFVGLQIYQAFLSAQASEHAARMVAMRNASENARELLSFLEVDYNKLRQQMITNEISDIVGGARSLPPN